MPNKITSVSYGKTINIGNYESIRIDLTASVHKMENWQDVLTHLKGLMVDEERKAKGINRKKKSRQTILTGGYDESDFLENPEF